MTLLKKTLAVSAFIWFTIWMLISVARIVKHGILVATEPSRYPEPVNTGSDFNFYKNRFYQ